MKKHQTFLLTLVGVAGVFAISAEGIAASEIGDSEKPTIADDRYQDLLKNSPFLRPLDLSRSLVVTGFADVEGETLATIFDREDSSTTLVTNISGNERGMKITGVSHDRRSKQVALKISVRGAEIEIPFDVDALLPRPGVGAAKPEENKDGRGGGDRGRGRGGSRPPQHIMTKYYSLNEEQRGTYWKWAKEYYSKNPELRNSEKRYPVVEKALDAVKSGGKLPST